MVLAIAVGVEAGELRKEGACDGNKDEGESGDKGREAEDHAEG